MLVTLGGAATLAIAGRAFLGGLRDYIDAAFRLPASHLGNGDLSLAVTAMHLGMDRGMALLAPIAFVLLILALAAPLMTGGIAFRTGPMAPKLEKFDPIKGLQRMFGTRAIMELVKALMKFGLLLGMALLLLYWTSPTLRSLGTMPLDRALGESAGVLIWCFVALSATLIIIAGIDLPFQIFQHNKKLRMTRQEVVDEMKETEGRPEVKQRQRSLQFEASKRRLDAVVPTATVVVTNPTHYAVALRYEESMTAPVVVASGAGELAAHIRQLARQHGIPMLSAPPLARALYFGSPEGQQIPADLYRAVAQVLIYVMQLNALKGRERAALRPPVIRDTDIPAHLRREEHPS